jgi:DNA repair exonuclease SbcCD nuclease subunit
MPLSSQATSGTRSITRPWRRDLFLKKLLQYHKSGFEIILISGNHDYLEPGLTHLRHITLQTDLQRLDNVVAADTQVKLHLSNGYIFLLMPSGAYREDDFNREVRRYVKEIEESSFYVDYKGIIVVAHFAVKKCAADVAINGGTSQFRMPDGIIIEGDLPVTYIALGDLHICQRVAPGCYYSGSPIQTRWGETPDKGVLLVDTDDPDKPHLPLHPQQTAAHLLRAPRRVAQRRLHPSHHRPGTTSGPATGRARRGAATQEHTLSHWERKHQRLSSS